MTSVACRVLASDVTLQVFGVFSITNDSSKCLDIQCDHHRLAIYGMLLALTKSRDLHQAFNLPNILAPSPLGLERKSTLEDWF